MPLKNIPSVLKLGILSNDLAGKIPHESVAMDEMQEKRDKKQVPGGRRLHQYANLYFHARNPMMYKRKAKARELCVLRISTDVCEMPGVVFADSNASGGYVRFLSPSQWHLMNFDDIFASDWRHPNDPIAFYRHKSRKCAEVLVPDRVETRFLKGAWVADELVGDALGRLGFPLPIEIDPVLFFQ
jgi:hypothetical protein